VGGPVRKDRIVFFTDYQGTQTVEGISSRVTSVPSLPEHAGNFDDVATTLTGAVSGPSTARLLSQKLGYTVFEGEPYYTPGCKSPIQCVLPNASIPTNAWSAPARSLVKYIPLPNIGRNLFSTSAYPETVRDDKSSSRIDTNTRWGSLYGYYFLDDYRLDNPYPDGQGGASIPGFDALTVGRVQLISLSDTKFIRPTFVNEFRLGFLRNVNNIGQTARRFMRLASIARLRHRSGNGWHHCPGTRVRTRGEHRIPIVRHGRSNHERGSMKQHAVLGDVVSKVLGAHTLKFGGQFHIDQVNENPNATFYGTFNVTGTETRSAFADFLLGFQAISRRHPGSVFTFAIGMGRPSWRTVGARVAI
jgi:hypothetical protein